MLNASDDVARLFYLTRRALIGRDLYTFFDAEREAVIRGAAVAATGSRVTLMARVRPRDRKPLQVRVVIEPTSNVIMPDLRWTLSAVRETT